MNLDLANRAQMSIAFSIGYTCQLVLVVAGVKNSHSSLLFDIIPIAWSLLSEYEVIRSVREPWRSKQIKARVLSTELFQLCFPLSGRYPAVTHVT